MRRLAAPEFLAEVRWKAERLRAALERLVGNGVVRSVRGVGLMIGIELSEPAAPRVAAALERGLLVCSAGERVVRLLPPLAIEPADLDAGCAILAGVLA